MRLKSLCCCSFLMLCVLCCRIASAKSPIATEPATVNVTSIENPFLRVLVNNGPDEMGRFALATTGGDPEQRAGNNQPLISGGKKMWSSYTTVQLDNDAYVVGGPTNQRAGLGQKIGTTLTAPTLIDNQINYSEKIGDVEVAQKLGLVRGHETNMTDTVCLSYTLSNRGTVNHQVGVRVLLDTLCGGNDGAPICLGTRVLDTPTLLSGNEVPVDWRAFDKTLGPNVIFRGIMRGGAATPPDQVIFADWGTLADNPWQPTLHAEQGFLPKNEKTPDTAAALLWQPVLLQPGKTITLVTYCTIGYITLARGELTLKMTASDNVNTYDYKTTAPLTFTGGLQNTGKFNATDVVMTLNVPEGLEMREGSDPLTIKMHLLGPDQKIQGQWLLAANGKAEGVKNVTIAVTSSNFEDLQQEKAINLIVPKQRVVLLPAQQSIAASLDDPQSVTPEVKLSFAQEFAGINFTVKFDPNVILYRDLMGNTPTGAVEIDNQIAWTADVKDIDSGSITFHGQRVMDPDELTPFPIGADMTLYTLTFRTVKPGKSALTLSNVELINDEGGKRTLDLASEVKNGEIDVVPMPTITAFTPASGGPGTVVTITGVNFTGATAVAFGGKPAKSFTVVSPTSITATVDKDGSTGTVTVTTPDITVTSTAAFNFTQK